MTGDDLDKRVTSMQDNLVSHLREFHEHQKRESASRQAEQETLVNNLLQQQVEEAEQKAERGRMVNKILTAVVALVGTAGGTGFYFTAQSSKEAAVEAAAAERASHAEPAALRSLDKRVNLTERKIERLGEIAVEQQVQLSDSIEYIGKKIDAAHPSQRDKVKEPESVKAAKTRASKIKMRKGANALFTDTQDPTDPFSDL